MATTTASSANVSQLDRTISQLQNKLARQTNAVKDTEAHIEAIRLLKSQLESQVRGK